jgi:hypothetical protein
VFIVDASQLSVRSWALGCYPVSVVLARPRYGVGSSIAAEGVGGLGILSSARAPTSLRRFDFCIRAEG